MSLLSQNTESSRRYFVAAFAVLLWLPLLVFIPVIDKSQAHPLLMGGASGAGEATFDGVMANPAMASSFNTHHASFAFGPQYKTQQIRYPGFESNDTSGANFVSLPSGGGLYRVNSQMVVGLGLPIPGLSATVNFDQLPLNILGQQEVVDIEADGTILKVEGIAAFKINRQISVGVIAGFDNTSADVTIYESETGDEVAPVSVSLTKMRVRAGVLFKVNPKIEVGLATTAFQNEATEFKAEFLADIQAENQQAEGTPEITRTLYQTIAAVSVKVMPELTLLGEIEYNPAPAEKRLSLVDFTEQPIDGVMSVGGRLGAKYYFKPQLAFMFGGAYEPTNVGPGTTGTGDGDTTGYGFFDFNLASLIGQPVKPFWLAGGGVEYKFAPAKNRMRLKKRGRKARKRRRRQVATEYKGGVKAGVVFQQTSVGVDGDGEQPAAYLQQLIHIPISVYWNFYK